jgi:teichuronic acid biosynthesis glycosyltransferase TuaG
MGGNTKDKYKGSAQMKISILTPAYNEERHLPAMIESVQSQAHDDWQLLLVDDGSNDRTAEIIQDFAATDERIVPVSLRERFGKVEAFNRAAAAADGQVGAAGAALL